MRPIERHSSTNQEESGCISTHAQLSRRYFFGRAIQSRLVRSIGGQFTGCAGPVERRCSPLGAHAGPSGPLYGATKAAIQSSGSTAMRSVRERIQPAALNRAPALEPQHHAARGGCRAGARLALFVGNPRCSTIARTPAAAFTARQHPPPTSTPHTGEHVHRECPARRLCLVHSRRPLPPRLLPGRCLKRHARLLTCLGSWAPKVEAVRLAAAALLLVTVL